MTPSLQRVLQEAATVIGEEGWTAHPSGVDVHGVSMQRAVESAATRLDAGSELRRLALVGLHGVGEVPHSASEAQAILRRLADAPTMTVTVRDRTTEDATWGHGLFFAQLVTVEIPCTCLTCGGPTGEPFGFNGHEDGADYHVDRWINPCGHVDSYPAVLAAVAAGRGRVVGRSRA